MEDANRSKRQAQEAAQDSHSIQTASLSDVGRVRSENQDSFGEAADSAGNRLLIVADGMGGHRGGSTASRLCIETASMEFRESTDAVDSRLRRGLERANVDVHQASTKDPDLSGMGSTAVALALTPDGDAWVAWVGDSRAYRLRDGRLERMTDDHSYVAEGVRAGVISPEQVATHPRRNQLLRCVGPNPSVEVDVRAIDVRQGDRFLLCSDGLWGEVPEAEIATVLSSEPPAAATQTLVDRANQRGGPDNITVQILSIGEATAEVQTEGRESSEGASLIGRGWRIVRRIGGWD